jgi:hypothetical protein
VEKPALKLAIKCHKWNLTQNAKRLHMEIGFFDGGGLPEKRLLERKQLSRFFLPFNKSCQIVTVMQYNFICTCCSAQSKA